jgi:hypothetical protein
MAIQSKCSGQLKHRRKFMNFKSETMDRKIPLKP